MIDMIDMIDELEKDIVNGMRLTNIAQKYQWSLSTTHRRLKKLGLTPTKRKYYLKGNEYGRLKVLCEDDIRGNASWLCQCKCGNILPVRAGHLIDGSTQSCGCLAHELKWTGCGEISGDYWCRVVRGAKKRNFEVTVTVEEAWQLFLSQNRKCALSGVELVFASNFKDKQQNQTASLDRKDSSKGYIIGNIQWIHKIVQLMKMNLNETLFLEFCNKIALKGRENEQAK